MAEPKVTDYVRTADALAFMLRFRVRDHHVEHVDVLADGRVTIRSVRPAERVEEDLWEEAVRYRLDHENACKLAWDLYMAGTGHTITSFNGMPAGGPVREVKEERKRLLGRIADLESQLAAITTTNE